MVLSADIRYACRALVRNPALTLVVVFTLGLAVAFNGAAASLLDALLVRPYPYPNIEQLVLVRDARPREGAHQGRPLAVADFVDVGAAVPALAGASAWRPLPLVVTSADANPERLNAAAVSPNFFSVLGIAPLAGGTFAADADQPGRDRVVVISRRLWNSRFGAAPDVVGREVTLNGRGAVVAGVIRDEDCYPPGADVWVPLVLSPAERGERAAQTVAVVGRLARGRSEARARQELQSLAERLARTHPLTNRDRGFGTLPLRREQYEFTAPLFGLVQAAALLVLLVAAINVANLLVARTLDRQHELAVRTFIGASRAAVAAIVMCEAIVPGVAAIGLGLVASGAMLGAVRASLPEGIARWIAGWSTMTTSPASIAATAALGAAAVSAIAVTASIASIGALGEPFASSRAAPPSVWRRRLLVAAEVGATATLLVGAAVIVSGLDRIQRRYDAVAPDRLLRFTLTLPEWRYPEAAHVAAFHASVLDALRATAGVESAAMIRNEPASNVPTPTSTFQFADAPAASAAALPAADLQTVSPDLFRVLRIDIVEGRRFADTDAPGRSRVAIVSREAVRRFWNGRTAVGTRLRIGGDPAPVQVVGVASNAILNWYDPEMRPVIYLPDAQAPSRTTTVMMRTRADASTIERDVRRVVASLDARQPLAELEPLMTTIADSLSPLRVIERLLLGGAAVSALLAGIGIYSVLARSVHARRREIGIRYAVGATQAGIAWLVVRESMATAAAGAAVGVAAGAALVRIAGSAMLGVPMVDARAVLAIAAATALITIVAALTLARRAARIDVAELLHL